MNINIYLQSRKTMIINYKILTVNWHKYQKFLPAWGGIHVGEEVLKFEFFEDTEKPPISAPRLVCHFLLYTGMQGQSGLNPEG
jgi:hypothetical protein